MAEAARTLERIATPSWHRARRHSAPKTCNSFDLLMPLDDRGGLRFLEIYAISRGVETMADKFVILKFVAAIFVFIAIPVLAYGQQGGPPPNVPKPTKADVQKVVQIISSDQTKLRSYCDLKKLYDQMGAAYQKNDSKTADALGKQADALADKLGPEYSKMMDGLEQVDQNSSEGKAYASILSGLDKLCIGPAQAQAAQPAPVAPAPAPSAPAQSVPAQPAPAQSVPAQPAPAQSALKGGPCAQIRTVCAQAGFVPNGANMGVGMVVDCIRPIMAGTPQRPRSTKPLPQIDPQVVIACKNQNPNFGMGGGARAQPNGRPTPNPSGTTEGPGQ
jgi:hypothetical protein